MNLCYQEHFFLPPKPINIRARTLYGECNSFFFIRSQMDSFSSAFYLFTFGVANVAGKISNHYCSFHSVANLSPTMNKRYKPSTKNFLSLSVSQSVSQSVSMLNCQRSMTTMLMCIHTHHFAQITFEIPNSLNACEHLCAHTQLLQMGLRGV